MSWILRHRCRSFLRSSLSAAAIASMAAALPVAALIRRIDARTQWTLMNFGADGSRLVLGALASSVLTFIVFAFSIMLLAVQVAGGQLSPRIIARLFQNRLTKLTLSAFAFSFVYTLAALGRIEERVPQLPVLVAVLSSLISVVLFLYLIQRVGESFRPVIILTNVAADTRSVIHTLYPHPFSKAREACSDRDNHLAPPNRTIVHNGRSSVVLALNAVGLVEIANQAGCTVELVPQIGDFLATGAEMFHLYGAGAEAVNEGRLRRCIALGPERTLEKDPAFGFRILVDIASKALSPAINDPTTGALVVDQIHNLLRLLGQRQLDEGVVRDSSGEVRLVYRTPRWEDFVTLAVTELRLYGASNPQVTRRLQGMFEQLMPVLPAERAEMLQKEMARLQRTIERTFANPEDRVLAGTADLQGFGGRSTNWQFAMDRQQNPRS